MPEKIGLNYNKKHSPMKNNKWEEKGEQMGRKRGGTIYALRITSTYRTRNSSGRIKDVTKHYDYYIRKP